MWTQRGRREKEEWAEGFVSVRASRIDTEGGVLDRIYGERKNNLR